jgi:hypothetical protein
MSAAIDRIFGLSGKESAADPANEAGKTPAEVAGQVRAPARLQAARVRWRDLKRRHDDLQQELRSAVIELDSVPQALRPEFERRINEIDARVTELGGGVRAALQEVSEATAAFAQSVSAALAPMRSEAADQAIRAIDRLAGEMSRLAEIDNELRPLGGAVWELRRLSPDLGNLRRRIIGLSNG